MARSQGEIEVSIFDYVKTESGAIRFGEETRDGEKRVGPVCVNKETGAELVVDVNTLYGKVGELNRECAERRKAMEAYEAKFSGIDPEGYRQSLTELEQLREWKAKHGDTKAVPSAEDVEAAAKSLFGVREAELSEQIEMLKTQADKHKAALHSKEAELNSTRLKVSAEQAIADAGVRAGNRMDALAYLAAAFEISEEGSPVHYEGSGDKRRVKRGSDMERPQTMKEHLDQIMKSGERDWWDRPKGTRLMPGGALGADPANMTTTQLAEAALRGVFN